MGGKVYDLEDRTEAFAAKCRALLRRVPRTLGNIEDGKQLLRASGSVGANYIEAREASSKRDFLYRVKVSRKEAKETRYWLRLLHIEDQTLDRERAALVQEATELLMILSAIVQNSAGRKNPG